MNAAATPAGGWDCHAHLFGPYERFPLAAQRSYTPPEALEPQYMALLRRLGLAHGVLVHPSAYGDDHSLLLHALSQAGDFVSHKYRDQYDFAPTFGRQKGDSRLTELFSR